MIPALNLISFVTLILTGILGLWLLAPEGAPLTAWLILSAVLYAPLAVFLPGVARRDPRLLAWLCFLLLFYFCGYVAQLPDPAPVRTLALLKVTLTSLVFVLSVLVIREGRGSAR